MNYTKPEITSLASASLVIKSEQSKLSISSDDSNSFVTGSAYESDE
jgi:hypothetical protein